MVKVKMIITGKEINCKWYLEGMPNTGSYHLILIPFDAGT